MLQPDPHQIAVHMLPATGSRASSASSACCRRPRCTPDLLDCLLPGAVTTVVDEFVLDRTPETLHGGIVVAVALSAHRRLHAELRKELLIVGTTILAVVDDLQDYDMRII
jgi:hypothetical protein